MRKRLLWSYVGLTAVVLMLLEVPLGVVYARRERDALSATARRDATALAVLAGESIEHPTEHDLQTLARRYHSETGAEVAISDSAGQVVVGLDPTEHKGRVPDLGDEVAAALAGRSVTTRQRDAEGPETIVALPIRPGKTILGSVVVAVPGRPVESRIHVAWVALVVFALGLLAVAALVGLWLARTLTRPLSALGRAAGRLGAGDLDARAPTGGPPEVVDLAVAFNTMADRLADLVGAERRFVADASHQLRTPLTALRLRLENAADRSAITDDDLEAAQSEVDRLSRLVDGLLALSRAGEAPTHRQAIDLASVIDERSAAWAALAAEHQVELRVSMAADSHPLVSLTEGHLEQILDNLLANAVEASPPGEGITVTVTEAGADVVVDIRDRGPGLNAEQRRRAFDRFWQADGQATGSSGLGLAIVRELVHANQARIALRAPDDGGLEAVITLRRHY